MPIRLLLFLFVALFLSCNSTKKSTADLTKSKFYPDLNNYESTIQFSFDIVDLETNHQFEGQTNTFKVLFEYTEGEKLSSPGFDTIGHNITKIEFPYFQAIRDSIIQYAVNYHDKKAFYEIFGYDIAKYTLDTYPQLTWIKIEIFIPAFAAIKVHRKAIVVLRRKKILSK